jgi:hypothetical protein
MVCMKMKKDLPDVGPLRKRGVVMEDGKRYLIYYSFENAEEPSAGDAAEDSRDTPADARHTQTEESEYV